MDKSKKYFAFISYSHKDSELAKWLQHEFEYYELPATLDERKRKDLPDSFRPVFRDEDELAGGELKPQISDALANSNYLIVVCSPNSAKSQYVDTEINEFINISPDNRRRIFPFIVEGKPHQDEKNQEEECFPKSLLYLSEDKTDPIELIAGDIHATGRDHAFIKILAGTLKEKDISFSDLWDRYALEKAEKERLQREQRDNLLRLQSRIVAEKALKLVEEGDSYTARCLALEILPTPQNPNFPYTPEAERALRRSMMFDNAILQGFDCSVKYASISPNNRIIAAVDGSRIIRMWDSNNGQLLKTVKELPEFYKNINKETLINDTNKKPFVGFSPDSTKIIIPAIYLLYPTEKDFKGNEHCFHCVLEIRDVSSGELCKMIKYPDNYVILDMANYASISSNGKYILIASGRYTFFLWDIEKQAVVKGFGNPKQFLGEIPYGTAFVPYNNPNRSVVIYHATNLKDASYSMTGHVGSVNYVVFSPDEKRIVSASDDNTARIWSAVTGRELYKLEGHSASVLFANYSPAGGHILTVSEDGTAIIWSAKKGSIVARFPKETSSVKIVAASFCVDDKHILTAHSDHTIAIWKVGNNSKKLRQYNGHIGHVNSIVCSNNGKWAISSSEDHTVRLWDIEEKCRESTLHGHSKKVVSLGFSPDGSKLISSSYDETIRIWDVKNRKSLKVFSIDNPQLSACYVAISPDGQHIINAFRYGIYLYDMDYHELGHNIFEYKPLSFEYSHDGKSIVVSLDNGDVQIIHVQNHDIQFSTSILNPREKPEEGIIYSTFSNSDKYVASAYENGSVVIYNVHNFQDYHKLGHMFEYQSGEIKYLLFSPDDKYLVCASEDYSIKIWNIEKNEIEKTLQGHTSAVSSLAFSPNGKYLASSSSDGTVIIWDYKSGVIIETLKGHFYEVISVKFSPDGRTIATASSDCTIKIWEFLPLEELVQKAIEKCANRQLTPEERRKYYLE